jgi:hypothetical protein
MNSWCMQRRQGTCQFPPSRSVAARCHSGSSVMPSVSRLRKQSPRTSTAITASFLGNGNLTAGLKVQKGWDGDLIAREAASIRVLLRVPTENVQQRLGKDSAIDEVLRRPFLMSQHCPVRRPTISKASQHARNSRLGIKQMYSVRPVLLAPSIRYVLMLGAAASLRADAPKQTCSRFPLCRYQDDRREVEQTKRWLPV